MNKRQALILAAVLGAALSTLVTGCSKVGVEPWERDILAQPEMQLNADPVETSLNEHMYFSKEASSGGSGFSGGGCGCN